MAETKHYTEKSIGYYTKKAQMDIYFCLETGDIIRICDGMNGRENVVDLEITRCAILGILEIYKKLGFIKETKKGAEHLARHRLLESNKVNIVDNTFVSWERGDGDEKMEIEVHYSAEEGEIFNIHDKVSGKDIEETSELYVICTAMSKAWKKMEEHDKTESN